MNATLESLFGSDLFSAPQSLGAGAVERGRAAALAAARAIGGAKGTSHALAEASLKMNAVIHGSLARLVTNNVRVLDGLMDEGVRRLELAAEASGLRPLFADQMELLADTRARLSDDAERTLAILADTRAQLGELLTNARPAAPAAKASGSAPTRAAKSAARSKKGARAKKRVTRRTRSTR